MALSALFTLYSLVVSVVAVGEFSILDVIMMSGGFALLQWS